MLGGDRLDAPPTTDPEREPSSLERALHAVDEHDVGPLASVVADGELEPVVAVTTRSFMRDRMPLWLSRRSGRR